MISDEISESSVRSAGDLAGVYEYDGTTGYFYLYRAGGRAENKVLASVHILSGRPDFGDQDVAVRWDVDEERVGLFIRGVLWAVFDSRSGTPLGGSYQAGSATPSVPAGAARGFAAGS